MLARNPDLIDIPDATEPVSDHPCPSCGPSCRSPLNRQRKTLRVWNDGHGFISWRCARCDTTGWKKGTQRDLTAPSRQQPQQPPQSRESLARALWARSVSILGTPAETYLRSRQCFLDTPNIRFLHGDKHPPTMIGRFQSGAVHLTRLNADGTGKAGTANDKLMFGPVSGSPLIIRDLRTPDERPLIICEGIEDGLSMALATNMAVWVSGSASMLPKLIPLATQITVVHLAFDLDTAGINAYRKALELRSDIRSIRFPKQLDANTIIRQPDGVARLKELVLRRPTFHR